MTATKTSTPSATTSATLTVTATISLTLSPSCSPTPFTPTASPTPTGARSTFSGTGGELLAPVPLKSGAVLVLYASGPLSSSHWEVYRVDLRKVAELDFGALDNPAWSSVGAAPGLYFVRLKLQYLDGSSRETVRKIVVVP